ncbi:hypothetical protein E5288_WYG017980 [Bos mutus]|uniref:Uncharacterized protein n=1 Tax=Bos mutus TaxID=72004 RepID=A0A6B0S9M8_9CETA|nr:hypothetical protein [Bos mutus]
MRLRHLLLALLFLVLSAGSDVFRKEHIKIFPLAPSEAASDTSGMSCGKMTLDRGFGHQAPVRGPVPALPQTTGRVLSRRLCALVGEMPELGKRKMENLECEKMGGACKYQNTHDCIILPGECKSQKKHCCRV